MRGTGEGKGGGVTDGFRRWARRSFFVLVPGVALYYLTFGGEYSVFDVRELEERKARAAFHMDSLQAVVDSLEAWADSLARDTLAIERLARERYGFIRDGERLYRFLPPGAEQESADGVDPPGGPRRGGAGPFSRGRPRQGSSAW